MLGNLPTCGEILTMRMCEHLNSDEELIIMPSYYESDFPEDDECVPDFSSESLILLSLILSSTMLDFNALTVYLFKHISPSSSPQT